VWHFGRDGSIASLITLNSPKGRPVVGDWFYFDKTGKIRRIEILSGAGYNAPKNLACDGTAQPAFLGRYEGDAPYRRSDAAVDAYFSAMKEKDLRALRALLG
jgi:hypothetical protein